MHVCVHVHLCVLATCAVECMHLTTAPKESKSGVWSSGCGIRCQIRMLGTDLGFFERVYTFVISEPSL